MLLSCTFHTGFTNLLFWKVMNPGLRSTRMADKRCSIKEMDTGLPDHATILSELNVVGCKRNSNHFMVAYSLFTFPKMQPQINLSIPHHEPSHLHELQRSHTTLYGRRPVIVVCYHVSCLTTPDICVIRLPAH